jgi:hypothetical protein
VFKNTAVRNVKHLSGSISSGQRHLAFTGAPLFRPHGGRRAVNLNPNTGCSTALWHGWLAKISHGLFANLTAAPRYGCAFNRAIEKLREYSRNVGMGGSTIHMQDQGCRHSEKQAAFHNTHNSAFFADSKKWTIIPIRTFRAL